MVSVEYPSMVTAFVLESVFFIINDAAFDTALGRVMVTAPDVAFTSVTLMPSVWVSVVLPLALLDEKAILLASKIWSKFVIYDLLILKFLLLVFYLIQFHKPNLLKTNTDVILLGLLLLYIYTQTLLPQVL